MKSLLLLFSLLLSINTISQTENNDKELILATLKAQEQAWNKGNLVGFMQGYWKSDSLKFYGKNGLTLGWQKTLHNYKKAYPSAEYTGNLKFTIDAITKIENGSYYVMGQYNLTRKAGNADGVFLIIFKKINDQWKIVADMSC